MFATLPGLRNFSSQRLPKQKEDLRPKAACSKASGLSNPGDSLHPAVKPDELFRPRNVGIAGEEVAQGVFGSLRDADAWAGGDPAGLVTVVTDPKRTFGGGQVSTVVAAAGDAESCTQPSGATGETA